MNKADLVRVVCERVGMSVKDVDTVITATFDEITKALMRNDDVRIYKFGRFFNKRYKGKMARNMVNNTCVKISDFYKVVLKVSGEVKDRVRVLKVD